MFVFEMGIDNVLKIIQLIQLISHQRYQHFHVEEVCLDNCHFFGWKWSNIDFSFAVNSIVYKYNTVVFYVNDFIFNNVNSLLTLASIYSQMKWIEWKSDFNPIQTSTRSHRKQKQKNKTKQKGNKKKHVNERKIKMTNLRSEFFDICVDFIHFVCYSLFSTHRKYLVNLTRCLQNILYTIHRHTHILPHRQIHLIFWFIFIYLYIIKRIFFRLI